MGKLCRNCPPNYVGISTCRILLYIRRLSDEGIIGHLFTLVILYLFIVHVFLFPPVVGLVEKIAGNLCMSAEWDFLWAGRPTFGVLGIRGGCDKWVVIVVILAFLHDVDHCVAVITMDDPRFA
jgi:hypothetical protein